MEILIKKMKILGEDFDKSQAINMVEDGEGVYITREEFLKDIHSKKDKTFVEEAIGEGFLGGLYRFFTQETIFGENKSSDVSEADKRRYG